MKNNNKNISREDLEFLINQKYRVRDILNILKISKRTLYNYLNKYGLKIPKIEYFDNTVFNTIDDEEKSYWLGFLYADGYVSSKNNNSVELSLSSIDIEHLLNYNSFLKNNKSIKVSKVFINDKMYERCRSLVTDKHFHDSLIKLGCIPQKSLTLKFPDINIFSEPKLINHFIRGYIDGDGSVYISKNNIKVDIIGTKEFLTSIINYLDLGNKKLYDTRSSKSGKNNYRITYFKKESIKLFYKLYKDSNIFLKRKYNLFAEFLNLELK